MSLQPCKHAVQTGRHTPCLPTARPPALTPPLPLPWRHRELPRSPESRGLRQTPPFFHEGSGPMRFLSGAGIRKRLWATRRGICSCPLQLQWQKGQITDLRLGPALPQNPWLGQELSPAHPKAEALHSSSACQECQGKTFLLLHLVSKHRAPAPAPSSSFCPTLLQSRIQKSFALLI